MTPTSFSERTTIVVGASRGLGRGIATSLAEVGAPIVAVARSRAALAELAELAHGAANIHTEVADPLIRRSPAPSWTAMRRAT